MLDASAILRGQIWRIITFMIWPPSTGMFFNLIAIYLYYNLGTTLEQVWGTFRFNLYLFMGILGHVLAALIIYLMTRFRLYPDDGIPELFTVFRIRRHVPGYAVPIIFRDSHQGQVAGAF